MAATGIETFLTRGPGENPTQAERAEVANAVNADLLLSLNIDGASSELAQGVATFHFGTDSGSSSTLGETLAERDAGDTHTIVARQLDAVLTVSGAASLQRAIVAYEPVWAIGTGLTPTTDQIAEVHAALRARLSGLLIGTELAAAKAWWLGRDVVIVGEGTLAGLYARALRAQGIAARQVPAEDAVLAGLTRARALTAGA